MGGRSRGGGGRSRSGGGVGGRSTGERSGSRGWG